MKYLCDVLFCEMKSRHRERSTLEFEKVYVEFQKVWLTKSCNVSLEFDKVGLTALKTGNVNYVITFSHLQRHDHDCKEPRIIADALLISRNHDRSDLSFVQLLLLLIGTVVDILESYCSYEYCRMVTTEMSFSCFVHARLLATDRYRHVL
jgi:hypothetical protein